MGSGSYIGFRRRKSLYQRQEFAVSHPGEQTAVENTSYLWQDCCSEGGEGEGRGSSSGDARASSAVTGFWWDGEQADVEIILSFDSRSILCICRAAMKLIKSTSPHHSEYVPVFPNFK